MGINNIVQWQVGEDEDTYCLVNRDSNASIPSKGDRVFIGGEDGTKYVVERIDWYLPKTLEEQYTVYAVVILKPV